MARVRKKTTEATATPAAKPKAPRKPRQTAKATNAEQDAQLQQKIAEQAAEIERLKMAKNNPVTTYQGEEVDSSEDLESVGFVRDENNQLQKTAQHESDVEVFDGVSNNHAEKLKFYEEILTITITSGSGVDGDNPVYLSVNGEDALGADGAWVPRNMPVKMKRKFVERLLRARPINYKSREVIVDGERQYVNDATIKTLYPFSIDHDPNPNGKAWKNHLLAQL